MLLIRGVTRPVSLSLLNLNYYKEFSSTPKGKKLQEMHDKIIEESRRIRPEILVSILHQAHFKAKEVEQKSLFTRNEISSIVDSISSNLSSLGHKEVTLLLETISEFPEYAKYSRSNPFMHLLLKRFNMMQNMQFDSEYIFRFLSILEGMRFPPIIIGKYVNLLVSRKDKEKKGKIIGGERVEDALRFFACLLELKFIPVENVRKFYEREIMDLKVKEPKDLCYLYYICRTLEKSLKSKIHYFSNKIRLHEIVFNPYSQLSTNLDTPNEPNPEQTKTLQEKLLLETESFLELFQKNIDVTKLKKELCKFYEYEKYPLDSSTALLISDINELKEDIGKFVKQNYENMEAFEFLGLSHTLEAQDKESIYNNYNQKAFKYMNTYERLLLLSETGKLSRKSASLKELLPIVSESKSISSKELQLITSMLSNLSHEEQLLILHKIEEITDNEDNQKEQ